MDAGNGNPSHEHDQEIRRRQQAVANLCRPYLPRPAQQIFNPSDMSRMRLSEELRQQALQIQDTLESFPELSPISDFWCAQMAILDPDDVDPSVERAESLQAFRETYGIVDNWEFGCKSLQAMQDLCPNVILSLTFNPQFDGYVVVADAEKFDMSAVKRHPEGFAIWLRAVYFLFQMACCDLEAIRVGTVVMHEAEGHNPRKGVNFKTFRKVVTELGSYYPMTVQRSLYFHSGVFMNLVLSMVRPFLPRRIRKNIVPGCRSEQRLDTIFNAPNPEAAQQARMKQFEELLKRRYHHEKTFTLL